MRRDSLGDSSVKLYSLNLVIRKHKSNLKNILQGNCHRFKNIKAGKVTEKLWNSSRLKEIKELEQSIATLHPGLDHSAMKDIIGMAGKNLNGKKGIWDFFVFLTLLFCKFEIASK